jgi:nitronate monooxygenase
MGADLAYIGSAFIATKEANAAEGHKQAIVAGRGEDILGTKYFTGVFGNYLRSSVVAAGLDPDNLPEGDPQAMMAIAGDGSKPKAWRDIWGSGQGIGAVTQVVSAKELVERLRHEYSEAKAAIVKRAESDARNARLAAKRPIQA